MSLVRAVRTCLVEPVLQGVVGEHDDSPTERQRVERRGQRRAPARTARRSPRCAAPGTYVWPGCPRCAASRRESPARTMSASRFVDVMGSFARSLTIRLATRGGEPLLAVVAQDAHQFGGGVGVDHLLGGQLLRRCPSACRAARRRSRRIRARPRRAGARRRRGRTARRRRRRGPARASTSASSSEDGVDQRDPVGVRREPARGALDREGVAVDADQVQCRMGGQQGLGVAAETEVGVDDDRRRARPAPVPAAPERGRA